MIASRVWPNATSRSTKTPLPSGPRCANARFIAASTALASGPGPVNPAIPHMRVALLSRPPTKGGYGLPSAGCGPAPRLRGVLHNPPDLVGRPSAGLIINPNLHLGD